MEYTGDMCTKFWWLQVMQMDLPMYGTWSKVWRFLYKIAPWDYDNITLVKTHLEKYRFYEYFCDFKLLKRQTCNL